MWALYDAIRGCSAPVSTIALGCNASAACLILAAGDKGLRFAATHASFMWHGGETTIEDVGPGTLRDAAAWMARESAHWCEAMARTTHPPGARTLAERAAFWEASLHDRQLWLDAKGMVRHGVVDKILPETE
jgi:ATP-dependent protease ClpP protease subunit